MAELRVIPKSSGGESEPPCEWCHPDYSCFKRGFNRMNCPRVEGLRFLSGEEAHYDKDGNMVWDVQAVSFKLEDEYEIKVSDE